MEAIEEMYLMIKNAFEDFGYRRYVNTVPLKNTSKTKNIQTKNPQKKIYGGFFYFFK